MSTLLEVTQELQTSNEFAEINSEHLESINDSLVVLNQTVLDIYDFLFEESMGTLEERREQNRYNERMLAALEARGEGRAAPGAGGDKESGEGGGGLLGGLAGGIGNAVVGFGRGMASLGALAPKIILGAGAIGSAITLIGAGIAGAAWLTGKAFPTFVEGIRSFEDVDGEAVKQAGDGLKSLGIGIAAWGGGQIAAGVGNLVTGIFGDGLDDMIRQMQVLGEADINAENVKRNSEAMKAFGLAMAAGGAGSAAGGVGTFVSGIAGGIGKLFGGDDPLDQLKEFGEARINAENVKNNAEAMSAFAKAMAIGASGTATGGIGTFISGVLGGIGEAFGGEMSDPLSQLQLFGAYPVNKDIVKNNAEAMMAFSGAITVGGAATAAGGIGTFVSGVLGGIGEAIGGEQSDPLSQLKLFGAYPVNKEIVKNNAEAMKAFSGAMPGGAAATASAGIGTFVSGILGGLGKLFGGDDPIDQLNKFGQQKVNLENVRNNAKAMKAFSNAMSGIQSVDTTEALSILGKNMAVAIPLMDAMANGGTFNPPGVDLPFLGDKADFGKGILDPSLSLEELSERVKFAQGVFLDNTTEQGISSVDMGRRPSGQLDAAAAERNELASEQQAAAGGAGGVSVQNNSSTNIQNSNQTVVKPVPGPAKPPRNTRDVQYNRDF